MAKYQLTFGYVGRKMILLATQRQALARLIGDSLKNNGVAVDHKPILTTKDLNTLYNKAYSAIIIEHSFAGLPRETTVDICNSLGHRVPVILLIDANETIESVYHQASDKVIVASCEDTMTILATVESFVGIHSSKQGIPMSIPYFNPHVPHSMLQTYGGIGILGIDISSFHKFALEYGLDVYNTMRKAFQNTLQGMWGSTGCFRNTDIVCQKSANSSVYYIFMNPSQSERTMPLPSDLEKIATRLGTMLQKNLWLEMFENDLKSQIPQSVKTTPLVGIGFCGVIQNPCIGTAELVESALDSSQQSARDNIKQWKTRRKEFIQTLIQTPNIMVPHFQGIFNLEDLDEATMKQLSGGNHLSILADHIYGYEALIRINRDVAAEHIDFQGVLGIESKHLKPEFLFSMAKENHISLELDQACLRLASRHGAQLAGRLMINVLPRNLYHIDRLTTSFARTKDIVFEVSESEPIHNFTLLVKSCDFLKNHQMEVAADDFGKGFSSLDRILQMKPSLVKFDRAIIQNVHVDPVKKAYLEGMIAAGKKLGATLLAEGVESCEEALVLKKMGVQLIQGFLFHKPQSLADINRQLVVRPGKLTVAS